MSLEKIKKVVFLKRLETPIFCFLLTIFGACFLAFGNVKVASAVEGIMNGKTITGETDNYLFWLQTYDPATSPYFFDRLFVNKAGNVGIGTTIPGYKLDVAGPIRLDGILNTNNSFEKIFSGVVFSNGVANQAVDISLGNISFWGYIEVEVNSTYGNQNSTGKLTKIFAVGTNPNNNIYTNESRISDAMGTIPDNMAIGDLVWDSTNSTYKIPLSHIVSTSNTFTVKVRMFSGSSGAKVVFDNIALSGVYTLTALSRQYVYYNGNVGIGTSTPNAKLQVMGSVNATGLCLSGDCKVSWADIVSAGGVGTGTSGQTLRNNGTSWIADSNIYNNGTYVGIGTTVPGTDTLAVDGNIAGNAALKITNSTSNNWVSGNFGVGNASNGSSKLSIFGNQSIGTGYFSSAAPTNGLIVEGNVGIGTTNPASMLHIGSAINTGTLEIQQPTAAGSYNQFRIGIDSWAAANRGLRFQSWNNSGSYEEYLIYNGRISGATPTYTQGSYANFQAIKWGAAGMSFLTYPTAGAGSESTITPNTSFFIGNSGSVGIGTTNPTSQLDILSNKAISGGLSLRVLVDAANKQGYFGVDGAGLGGSADKIYFGGDGASGEGKVGSASALNFQTAYATRLYIANNGNVGIGTTTPNAKLQVMGSVNATGLCLSGDCRVSWADIVSAGGVGTGTSGQTLRNNGTGWIADSNIYNNGTYVGIGTTVPGTDVLAVDGNISGNAALKITNSTANNWISGNVGIGNASNGSSKLAIFGNQSIGTSYFNYAAPTNGLIVEGNVGIGTTAPGAKLNIAEVGSSSTPLTLLKLSNNIPYAVGNGLGAARIELGHGTGLHGYIEAGSSLENDSSYGYMAFGNRQPTNNIVEVMRIDKNGNVGIGTTNPRTKQEISYSTGGSLPNVNWIGSTIFRADASSDIFGAGLALLAYQNKGAILSAGGTGFSVATYDGTTTPSTRLSILTNGNVGVGNTNPLAKLQIENQAAFNTTTPGPSSYYGLHFSGQTTSDYATGITWNGGTAGTQAGLYVQGSGSYGTKMYFATTDSYATGAQTRMMINHTGNVGIGTTTPASKLQVAGSITATGLCFGADCRVSWADIVSAGGVGTGTSGQTLRNNGTSWIADSNIYNNGTYVGIGTTNPVGLLHVRTAVATTTLTFSATGGTITYIDSAGLNPRSSSPYAGGYTVHTFTSSGTFTPNSSSTVQVLVVGAGGGGNGGVPSVNMGAGGAGGTVRYNAYYSVSGGVVVTVGTGGAGVGQAAAGSGGYSQFGSLIANGGAGVSNASLYGGSNTDYSGGHDSAFPHSGGGAGGGANGSGINGGAGYLSSITGTATYYAGGGGEGSTGVGGVGGGGSGVNGGDGQSGTTSTGGGGAGCDSAHTGGSGGSGVVIIRYPSPGTTASATDALVVSSTGNVGIGTINPIAKLNVNGSVLFSGPTNVSPTEGELVYDTSVHAYKYYNASTWQSLAGGNITSTGSFWTQNGTLLYYTAGNVGIGTTTPIAKLQVAGTTITTGLAFSGAPADIKTSWADIVTAGGNNLWSGTTTGAIWSANGTNNVGIGDTNPTSGKLSVVGDIAGSLGVRAAASASSNWLAGNVGIGNASIGASKLSVFGNQSIGTGYFSYAAPTGGLIVEGNVGIGTTNPAAVLQVNGATAANRGQLSLSSSDANTLLSFYAGATYKGWIQSTSNYFELQNWNSGSYGPLVLNQYGGNVGIGTTNPTSKLYVAGAMTVTGLSTFNASAAFNGGITMIGTTSDITLNGNDIKSVDKLTANVVDPLYNIKGTNYSTFASAIAGGLKEEYVGRISASAFSKKDGYYETIIDLAKEKSGSDLWVWYNVIEFNDKNVEVFLTPRNSFASVYSLVSGSKIIVRADRPVDLSMRLIGSRFDWRKWPTKPLDQTEKSTLIIK